MLRVLFESWALFLGIGLLMMGNSLQGSLLGIRGGLEGFDPEIMGYVMSAYFAGFAGGSLIAPRMIKRVGYIRVFAALGSLISAAFIIYAVLITPWAWAIMRFVVGFCFSGVYVVAESWLNNTATNENRGQTLSLYTIVQMVGVVSGQALLNVASPAGVELFVIMSVVVSISFAPILLSVGRVPPADDDASMSVKELFVLSPLGCVGSFLLGGIFAAIFGMGAVYGAEIGLDVTQISFFLMMMYAPTLIAQYPIGFLSDKMDRRIMIVGCAGAAAAACFIAILGGTGIAMNFIAATVLGATINPIYSLLIAYTNDHLPREKMAGASGVFVMLTGMGAVLGPVMVGYFMQTFGPRGYFAFIGLLSAAIALYTVYRMTQRAALAPEETGSFIPMPGRGPVMVEMASEIYAEEAEEIAAAPENENSFSGDTDGADKTPR